MPGRNKPAKNSFRVDESLPPVDTVHKFSGQHYDRAFIDRTFEILKKHMLKPVDRSSWYRSCWHSNYGYCFDNQHRITFVKIFRPHLIKNFQMELIARESLETINNPDLYVPKVLSSYPEDLCVVMEPVTGRSLSNYIHDSLTRKKILQMLISVLADIKVKTSSPDESNVNEWISSKVQQYSGLINEHRDVLEEFPNLWERSTRLEWLNDGFHTFALGDVTPTHVYWDEQRSRLIFIDLELAGLKPEFYDLVFFAHRLLTRYPGFNSTSLYSTILWLFTQTERRIMPQDVYSFRNNLMSLLNVRLLGGLVDCLVIGDGTQIPQHLRAWKLFLKLQANLIENI